MWEHWGWVGAVRHPNSFVCFSLRISRALTMCRVDDNQHQPADCTFHSIRPGHPSLPTDKLLFNSGDEAPRTTVIVTPPEAGAHLPAVLHPLIKHKLPHYLLSSFICSGTDATRLLTRFKYVISWKLRGFVHLCNKPVASGWLVLHRSKCENLSRRTSMSSRCCIGSCNEK